MDSFEAEHLVVCMECLILLVEIDIGAGEGNRTLVSTYPVLFLCKPLF
jgi:hypothetical protein